MIIRLRDLLIIFFISFSCVDPFPIEVLDSSRVLVIDASLSTEQTAHTVLISFSFDLDQSEETPVTGAEVWVEDGNGVRTNFDETGSGIYQTDSSFQAIAGNTYKLHLVVDGMKLESESETIPDPSEILDIYGRFLELPSQENETFLKGIQFFVDARGNESTSPGFRFEYEETYEIKVPFPSFYTWNPEDLSVNLREESVGTCFKTTQSSELLLASTAGLNGSILAEYPIRYIEEIDPQLRHRYSILVKQFTISQKTIQYYRDLKETNESSGGFFDTQKGTTFGNIKAVNEESVPILGYFEVAGVSQMRRTVDSRDFLDEGFRVPLDPRCLPGDVLDTVPIGNLPRYFQANGTRNLFTIPVPGIILTVTERCSDCRQFGELKRPDYWDQ